MDDTRDTIRRELEDALGERISEDEARRAVERPPATRVAWLRQNRLLVLIAAGVLVVLGAMASLVIGSFWFVALAAAVHLAATFVVATLAIKLSAEVEKPDPVTVARLEARGVDDVEQRINMAIRSHGHGRAAAQRTAMTPSANETRLAGPGSAESLRESA